MYTNDTLPWMNARDLTATEIGRLNPDYIAQTETILAKALDPNSDDSESRWIAAQAIKNILQPNHITWRYMYLHVRQFSPRQLSQLRADFLVNASLVEDGKKHAKACQAVGEILLREEDPLYPFVVASIEKKNVAPSRDLGADLLVFAALQGLQQPARTVAMNIRNHVDKHPPQHPEIIDAVKRQNLLPEYRVSCRFTLLAALGGNGKAADVILERLSKDVNKYSRYYYQLMEQTGLLPAGSFTTDDDAGKIWRQMKQSGLMTYFQTLGKPDHQAPPSAGKKAEAPNFVQSARTRLVEGFRYL